MSRLLYPDRLRSVGTLFLVWANVSAVICHVVDRPDAQRFDLSRPAAAPVFAEPSAQ